MQHDKPMKVPRVRPIHIVARALIARYGYTQEELAKVSGMSQSSISRLLTAAPPHDIKYQQGKRLELLASLLQEPPSKASVKS